MLEEWSDGSHSVPYSLLLCKYKISLFNNTGVLLRWTWTSLVLFKANLFKRSLRPWRRWGALLFGLLLPGAGQGTLWAAGEGSGSGSRMPEGGMCSTPIGTSCHRLRSGRTQLGLSSIEDPKEDKERERQERWILIKRCLQIQKKDFFI